MEQVDVRHIAKLAMLKFSDEEVDAFEKEFADILNMVEKLPAIEGAGTLLDPSNQMELREDTAQPSYPREAMLQNVPHTIAGCIVVPKTVD